MGIWDKACADHRKPVPGGPVDEDNDQINLPAINRHEIEVVCFNPRMRIFNRFLTTQCRHYWFCTAAIEIGNLLCYSIFYHSPRTWPDLVMRVDSQISAKGGVF